ncbi:hypothetical protein AHAS_Ahas11G0271000 [Arachis hypogaea]|uniref:Reverse transcriptase zinc-binding domain-containing protein n=1 Tax=Arachis hypogaea TaxID=3818 RepID=A0A445AY50_ARAHY|nr:hypothetical protein Ahy_B01g056192 [Arachis hypogaea]
MALLFKWWWKFNKENYPLWKRIMCSCNDLCGDERLYDQGLKLNTGLWSDIRRIEEKNERLATLFLDRLKISIGNGIKSKFWSHLWLKEGVLMNKFPRLYMIAANKDSLISRCGLWNGLKWV